MKWVNLFLVISIVCGGLIYLRYLKERRFLEAIVFLAAYFLPLFAIFIIKGRLVDLLKRLLLWNITYVEIIYGLAIIIVSPILFFWVVCLFFGGYDAFIKNNYLIHYLKNHFRKKYIKSKVVGFSLMIPGLLLFLLSLIYIYTGIWQFLFGTVSLVAYFLGAICVVIPKISESKINEIIRKIKRGVSRKMVLCIQYKNGTYDYVSQRRLDVLIKQESIKQFYRPQEKRWVNISIDSIRRGGSSSYAGVERRRLAL